MQSIRTITLQLNVSSLLRAQMAQLIGMNCNACAHRKNLQYIQTATYANVFFCVPEVCDH